MADSQKVQKQARVLVVDDESSITEVLEMALGQRYELFIAKTAEEALKICEEQPIDLLLTDFDMSEDNGSELIRKVGYRQLTTKCVLFSGRLDPDLWEQAINNGSRYILKKPFSLHQLGDLLNHLLKPTPPPKVRRHSSLAALPWQSELGQGITALAAAAQLPGQIVFLQTPGGRLPRPMWEYIFSENGEEVSKHTEKSCLLYDGIEQRTMDEQEQIAQQLNRSKKTLRFIVGSEDPDHLIEREQLHDQIYMQLNPETIRLPEPSRSLEDTCLYIEWFLAQHKLAFSDSARSWFQSKIEALNWLHIFDWIAAAISEHDPNSLVSKEALQRAYVAAIPADACPASFDDFLPEFSAQFESALRHLESALK